MPASSFSSIDPGNDKTIAQALSQAVERYGNRECFVFANARLGYRDLDEASDQVARAFLNLGVQHGDRVGIWMAGFAEWSYLYYGLAKIGAIMVPVNTRYKPAEMDYVLRKSGATALVFKDEVAGKDYSAVLGQALFEGSPVETIIGVTDRQLPGVLSFQDFLAGANGVSAAQLNAAKASVAARDIAMIQFTSGTTAFPKGAQLFQGAMVRGGYFCIKTLEFGPDDRFFSPQPFYHCGGSIQVMLSPLLSGCTTIVQPYFDATDALRVMEREQATVTMGHQPHWVEYLNHPDLHPERLSLERATIFANPDVNQLVRDKFGLAALLSPYGMTETHLGGTRCTLDDPPEVQLNTVGRPMDGVEMALRDVETGQPVDPGQTGEIWFRGWCLMKGYYADPDKTAEAMAPDGWFRTGDLGIVRPDGCLKLLGRVKDVVRVGGENVAAAEVEGLLLRHPAVKQALYVGRPDDRLGEVGVAFVELKQNASASEADVIAYCRDNIASFKVPRVVQFVDGWPMSGTGKIQKFLLKELLVPGR